MCCERRTSFTFVQLKKKKASIIHITVKTQLSKQTQLNTINHPTLSQTNFFLVFIKLSSVYYLHIFITMKFIPPNLQKFGCDPQSTPPKDKTTATFYIWTTNQIEKKWTSSAEYTVQVIPDQNVQNQQFLHNITPTRALNLQNWSGEMTPLKEIFQLFYQPLKQARKTKTVNTVKTNSLKIYLTWVNYNIISMKQNIQRQKITF